MTQLDKLRLLIFFDDTVGFSSTGKIELASYRVSGLVHWLLIDSHFKSKSTHFQAGLGESSFYFSNLKALEGIRLYHYQGHTE